MPEQSHGLRLELRLGSRIEIHRQQKDRSFREGFDVIMDATHFRGHLDRQTDRIEKRQERTDPDHQKNDPAINVQHALSECHRIP